MMQFLSKHIKCFRSCFNLSHEVLFYVEPSLIDYRDFDLVDISFEPELEGRNNPIFYNLMIIGWFIFATLIVINIVAIFKLKKKIFPARVQRRSNNIQTIRPSRNAQAAQEIRTKLRNVQEPIEPVKMFHDHTLPSYDEVMNSQSNSYDVPSAPPSNY